VPEVESPAPRKFDCTPYQDLFERLGDGVAGMQFERATAVIVQDILENYEGFRNVRKGPGHWGTPFDFFGFKDGYPYIIEYKGSRKSFNAPGETQKRRLQEVLSLIKGLKVALLQVKIADCQYRILYHEQVQAFFQERRAPLEPIIAWIKEQIASA